MTKSQSREAMDLGERGFTIDENGKHNVERFAQALAVLDVVDDQGELVVELQRPRVRGDCTGGERPCPWVACRHHLAIDVLDTGSLRITSHLDLEALPATCSLDLADAGEHTLEEVGRTLNLTRERVRQLEVRGLHRMKANGRYQGIREDFVPDRNTPARPAPGRTE